MAIRSIMTVGTEVLREKAKPVAEFNEKLAVLLDDMRETMLDAKGAGLAAPQVGILRRVAVVTVDEGATVYELVNPVIIDSSGEQIENEGCLSIPDKSGYVKRPTKITIKARNRHGKEIEVTSGDDPFLAIAFCHELDHLDGVLYTDKVIEGYEKK